mgnify:CR=1 FL=1
MTPIKVSAIVNKISFSLLGNEFRFRIEEDLEYKNENGHGRIFIQVQYSSPCVKTGMLNNWAGRKWFLSKFMTDDEIVKTCYLACEIAARHEIMEGFNYNNQLVFNPHTPYQSLIKASKIEIKRK